MPVSITFRPTIDEFNKYRDDFINRFISKFKDNKYVIAPEKANQDFVNHYQIFLDTDNRIDSIKRSIDRITKDFDFSCRKVAIRCKNINTNISGVIGYCLKEQDLSMDSSVMYNGYTLEALLSYQAEYKQLSLDKRQSIDKIRVKLKNFHIVFKNYYDGLSDVDRLSPSDFDNTDDFYTYITSLFYSMARDGYEMFDLLLSDINRNKIIKLLIILYFLDK